MRIAALAAFPFPAPLGSQVFVIEQLRALAEQGARTTLFTYGSGIGPAPAEFETRRIPAWTSPHRARAGPQWRKPVADAALLARFLVGARRERFDLVLAHNAEAALIALATRPVTGIPVVYVAHTLLAGELASYAPPVWQRLLDPLGAAIDGLVARRADAVLALCRTAALQLGRSARGPVAMIPPGLAVQAPPSETLQLRACAQFGLEPGRFALYAGNLDGYQGLDVLDGTAARLAQRGIRLVVATQSELPAPNPALMSDALTLVRLPSFDEVRALCFAAGVLVLPRRLPGGFPIKLLNYMEAAKAIVAFEPMASGLEHGRTAWILPGQAGSTELALAIRTLLAEPARAAALGRAARQHLLLHHDWQALARQTLRLLRR